MADQKMQSPVHSILVPIDGSDPSVRALTYAGSIAPFLGASITGLYVVDPDKVSEEQPFNIHFGEITPDLEPSKEAASEYLDELGKKLPASVKFHKVVSIGYPEKAIIRYADEQKIDLIIMGNSGKSAGSAFVTGSVSYYTIHHARCPVLIVK